MKLVRTDKSRQPPHLRSRQRATRASAPARLRGLGNTRAGRFVHEAYVELRKAHWPNREQTIRLTALVIAISLLMAVVLGLSDLGFDRLFEVITL